MTREELTDVLEMMTDPATIATTDTHDILYMNTAARKLWGREDGSWQHCWDTMRNSEKPCEQCHMCRILPAAPHEWDYKNYDRKTVYHNISRMVEFDPEHPTFLEIVRGSDELNEERPADPEKGCEACG
ncbi:MAG: hypothetical protein IIY92_03090 [Lachnospiraceae bacterium]|nr:hypothetical protein [Lachnospiraceae bacterium]MBQ1514942.1 hypothetical protein [Lachnospiraceae bacterium]MBQ3400417.1 hypothetical protein [Lachnospiraceae bacterium]